MMAGMENIKLPPWQNNPDKEPRRVGVELEMNGVAIDQMARILADHLQLSVDLEGRYQRVLRGDPAGDWQVELDFSLLKEMGRENREAEGLYGELMNSAEEALHWLSKEIVPVELVTPPLPMARLPELEHLIVILRNAGAKGTSNKLVNAFGLHFNPEIPSRDPKVLVAYLKAFFCFYDWLHQRARIDLTRRLTTFVDPFPRDYLRKVIAIDYWPDSAGLIDDYLKYNPTRNRALDLLPLFLFLDEARVRKVTQDPLIKARPTFHYRLPNCEIHRRDWGLYQAWNDWVEVERLAADPERTQACCQAYGNFLDQPLKRLVTQWENEVAEKWLSQ